MACRENSSLNHLQNLNGTLIYHFDFSENYGNNIIINVLSLFSGIFYIKIVDKESIFINKFFSYTVKLLKSSS